MKVRCITSVDGYKKGKISEVEDDRRVRLLLRMGYLEMYSEPVTKLKLKGGKE